MVLLLLGLSGNWSHVMYGDIEGYVSSSLLTAANTATATPTVTATPAPTEAPTPEPTVEPTPAPTDEPQRIPLAPSAPEE